MVFSVFATVPFSASALDSVTYIDANGNEQACTEYTVLTNDTTEISDGWYVINSDLEIHTLTCTGDVHLIVCDGCRLNDFSTSGSKHIVVNEGNSLNIYGQAEGTGQINVVGASYYAAIGSSGENKNSGVITINGGTITAKGGGSIAKGLSSCIGGTLGGSGTVVINGGTIKTNTPRNMISIGGGGPAPLFGIVAAPGYVTINGGVFEELGSSGSRIGGIGDSTVKLNWNNLNTKITAKSYAGTVTIEKPFTDGTDIFAAGVVSDNSILSEKTLVPAVHTVTWNNDDDSAIDTTIVAYGEAPTHANPTKPEDENNTYTFAGWNDGTSTYAPDALPEVTGDVTYTAQFDATPKPHTHDGITFEPWTSTNSMPSTAGNYYLTQDLTIHSEWRAPEGTTRICLNGHKITTYEHFLMVSGTALEIYDEEGGGSMDAVYRVGSMFWVKGGKFVLNGGTINGNVSTAGIVDVAANATFTMNGGTLTGRAVNRYDACGIRFTGSGGTFNMNGGEITGLSTVAGVTYFEKSDVTVNISGNSKIYGNTIRNGTTRNLYLPENTAVNVGELGSDATIGVTMQTPGVFTASTDTSNNDASKFFSDKSDYMVGKNADGQLVLGVPVASVTSNGTTTKYTELSTALTNWTDDSTLTLLADASISSAIESSGNKTLDLNGKTITMTGTDCILYVNGGSLTVNGNGGTLTGGKGGRNYGDSYRRGGAIDLKSGSLVLDNCNITNNTSSFGSAVFMAGSTVLTIQNGTAITNNVGGSSVLWVQGGTVNMTGGTISNNSATAVSMQSNNWYSDLSRFNMSGGTISNNTGSGVGFAGNQTGQCSVSGNAVIKDNTGANLNLSGSVLLNVNGELGDDASIGITKNPGVFTNSTDTSFNDASKFFSDKSDYIVGKNADGQLVLGVPRTVTWLNDDGTTIDTTTVADGAVPTHEAPTKLGYNFAGWKNGETTYAPNALPNVSGDITYTATFTPKKLISNCNLTLDGDIIINFNIDPSAAGLTPENIGSGKELTVTFEWAKDFTGASDKPKTDITKYSKTITVDSSNVGSKIPVSCPVCAAEMSCQVRATATLNGKTETKDYSVRDYADSVINPREDSSFANLRDNNPTAYAKLVNLVSAMVDYGARAQKVFNINTSDLANKNLTDYTMNDVTDDMFVTAVKNANGGQTASDMKDVAAQLGANYYTTSLIFLDRSTLRHYFTKKDSSFKPSLYDGNQSDTYYFKVKENIPAHELDKLQEFTVGSTTFYYSALDYARGLNASSAATPDMKDLAKSLYWYSRAAKGYIS